MRVLETEDGYKFYEQVNGLWTDTVDGIDYDFSFSDLEDFKKEFTGFIDDTSFTIYTI